MTNTKSQPYHISFEPCLLQLKQLKTWLKIENNRKTGLYHYIDHIARHFHDQTIALIQFDNKVLGYVTWTVTEKVAHIVNVAIKKTRRKRGIGKALVTNLFEKLEKQGILLIYLECGPPTSEGFWRKLGCTKTPIISGYSDKGIPCYYYPLTPSEAKASNCGEMIRLKFIQLMRQRQSVGL